ncbi:hypothetical protein ACH5RR_015248 [Cinchona calisaya]|uniref:TCP domain-containing protein n=1 Tax=Cinchona calisaya TaxID=153742 RepID=A0ABD2ZSK4_9GENT
MQDVSNQGSSKNMPKRAKGETIEMHGGRIVRSVGRKDRHSKVCTARGPRDRRVRLSPNTAIQFYDVQDRLGYDRPSKALDWLMKEAKSAIEALDDSSINAANLMQQRDIHIPRKGLEVKEKSNCSKSACGIVDNQQDYLDDTSINNFCFFSIDNNIVPPPSSTDFHTYPHGDLSSSRNKNQTQGLSLSFHAIQDFSFLFSSDQQGPTNPASSTPMSHYEMNSEIARTQRIFGWNSDSSNAKGSQPQESLINSLPLHFPSTFDHNNQLLFHREPLQSSFSSPNLCFSGNRFSSDDGLSEFSAADRIQGQEEQNPVFSKPSSATSLLHYQE